MSSEPTPEPRKRERSARYPGVPLADSVELARFVDDRGLDGLPADEIAVALGYKSAKTNTVSARLSAARQFGLMTIDGEGYALTPLARSILHPTDPAELPRLHRQALLEPPLYAELSQRLADKRVPDASILANILYHHHSIIAAAKQQAAESFLESARTAGALGDDGIFRPHAAAEVSPKSAAVEVPRSAVAERAPTPRSTAGEVKLDLRLWGADRGKVVRLRAPESMSAASLDRFLEALKLLIRVEEAAGPAEGR